MKIFELIKMVLDDEFGEIPGKLKAKTTLVNRRLEELTKAFNDLTAKKGPLPNYGDPATRFAYIYKYTTCHANIVAEKLDDLPVLEDLLARTGWIDVASIGGGPGSDFLGIVKHMIRRRARGKLKCYLRDKEPGWDENWADVDKHTADLSFRVSTHAQYLDVIDPSSWTRQPRHLKADLFTFVYFVSEVWRVREAADPYFRHLFQGARGGALFLFIDNAHSTFYDWFDNLATAEGLNLVDGRNSETFKLEYGEEKTELEPYFSLFTHCPRMQAQISWRLYRKP